MHGFRPTRPKPRQRTRGFSFIELIASVAILGILAAVAMPLAETTMRRQKEHNLRLALQEIRQGIDAYKQAVVTGSITAVPGKSGYPPSLTELTAGVQNAQHPDAPLQYFLRRIPRDPFYPDSSTPAIDTWGLRSYASPPESPAKGEDVFDVYSQSTATGMNGVPYAEW